MGIASMMKPDETPTVEEAEEALRAYQETHDNPEFYREDEETGGIVHWSEEEGVLRKALARAKARASQTR